MSKTKAEENNEHYKSQDAIIKKDKYKHGVVLSIKFLSSVLAFAIAIFSAKWVYQVFYEPEDETEIRNIVFADGELAITRETVLTALEKNSNTDFITIDTKAVNIDNNAFENCGLTMINIPNSITTIQEMAFANNPKLTEVMLSKNLISLGKGAFKGASEKLKIFVPIELMENNPKLCYDLLNEYGGEKVEFVTIGHEKYKQISTENEQTKDLK